MSSFLAKENKRFQVTKIGKNARNRDYVGCMEWLADAGVINICYCLNQPELPLKGNYDPKLYKIYYKDAGSLIPIEVKATDGATASLNNLLKEDKYPDIKYGIKFGYRNIGINGKFYTFPYFLAFMLKRFIAAGKWAEGIGNVALKS